MNTSLPLVSIIIPCYNAAKYIGATLASAVLQNYPNYEIIIIDDSSTDATAAVVKDFSQSLECIQFVTLPHSGKPSVSRNHGVHLAKGKYIAFLDSDDLWMPGKLLRQITLLEEQPDVALCYTMSITFGHSSVFAPGFEVLPLPHKVSLTKDDLLHKGNSITCSSVVTRTELIRSINGFNSDLTYNEDLDMWIRLAETGRYVMIPRLLVKYRLHPGQHSGSFADKVEHLKIFSEQTGYPQPQYSSARSKPLPLRIVRNAVHIAAAVYFTVRTFLD